MVDRQSLGLFLILSLGAMPAQVGAETHSIAVTGEYRMGDHDTPADAKRLASLNAKGLAIDQAVLYLKERPAIGELGLNAAELRAYVAGLLQIDEFPHQIARGASGTVVSTPVRIVIDPTSMGLQLKTLMRNERAKVELTRARDKIDGYRKDIEVDGNLLAAATELSEVQRIAQHRRDLLSFIETEQQMARTWSSLVGIEAMKRPDRTPEKEAHTRMSPQSPAAPVAAPDNAEEHRKKGALLNAQGQYDAAIVEFRQALSLMPDLTRAHLGLGAALQGKGDLEGALAEYKTVLSRSPDDADAHTNIGTVLQSKGDLDGAIAEYRTALRSQPDVALTHYNLGTALSSKGQVKEALAEYRTAIRLKPDLVEAYFDLGMLLKENDQSAAAADAFREYLKRAPNTPATQPLIKQAQTFLTESPGHGQESDGPSTR